MRYPILCILLIFLCGCAHIEKDCVFQSSAFSVFEAGAFDGQISLGELKKHGDFGLGTLSGLDGEMVILNNEFFQIKSDGKAYLLKDGQKSPFAQVCFFEADKIFFPNWGLDYALLCGYIDKNIAAADVFYAVKVQGKFRAVKVRSVPIQDRPYPALKEALEKQKIFNYENIEGTLVGFRFPQYMEGVSVPKYHLHFIDKGKTKGGHLLDCSVNDVSVELDELNKFTLEAAP